LGVRLGPLLSASVTEAPEGRILRLRRQEGKDLGDYSDQELHVIVDLRYRVGGESEEK